MLGSSSRPATSKVFVGLPTDKQLVATSGGVAVNKLVDAIEYAIIPPYSMVVDKRRLTDRSLLYYGIFEAGTGLNSYIHVPLPETVSQTVYEEAITYPNQLDYISMQLYYFGNNNAGAECYSRMEFRIRYFNSGVYLLTIPIVISPSNTSKELFIPLNGLLLAVGMVIEINLRTYCRNLGGSYTSTYYKFSMFSRGYPDDVLLKEPK